MENVLTFQEYLDRKIDINVLIDIFESNRKLYKDNYEVLGDYHQFDVERFEKFINKYTAFYNILDSLKDIIPSHLNLLEKFVTFPSEHSDIFIYIKFIDVDIEFAQVDSCSVYDKEGYSYEIAALSCSDQKFFTNLNNSNEIKDALKQIMDSEFILNSI